MDVLPLAHGALGPWDELIFLSVSAIFLVMMAVSWLTSRNLDPEDDNPTAESAPDAPDADHFQLK